MRNIVFLILLSVFACKSLKPPTIQYDQYSYGKTVRTEDGNLHIELNNPLHCPLRVWIFDDNETLQSAFDTLNPIVLNGRSDTHLIFPGTENHKADIRFSSRLGDPERTVKEIKVGLPFPKGRTYSVIQGNNTNFTHNTDWSRYAVDFDLKIGDTICAATERYVVGVVDQYKDGGPGEEWKSFGNFLTLYDPDSGLFTQYVHLVYGGSLIKQGDKVKRGQPIALSGKTGQTNVEHLHFNVLVPVSTNLGLHSIPFEFTEGYQSPDLKKNDLVSH